MLRNGGVGGHDKSNCADELHDDCLEIHVMVVLLMRSWACCSIFWMKKAAGAAEEHAWKTLHDDCLEIHVMVVLLMRSWACCSIFWMKKAAGAAEEHAWKYWSCPKPELILSRHQ